MCFSVFIRTSECLLIWCWFGPLKKEELASSVQIRWMERQIGSYDWLYSLANIFHLMQWVNSDDYKILIWNEKVKKKFNITPYWVGVTCAVARDNWKVSLARDELRGEGSRKIVRNSYSWSNYVFWYTPLAIYNSSFL